MNIAYLAYRRLEQEKRDELVQSHLPLVYRTAHTISKATALGTLEVDDLVSAGVLGLYKAADKFDASRGITFGTYASRFVKGAMLDELNRNKQLPRGIRDKSSAVRRAFESLTKSLSREPSDSEMADYLNIGLDTYGQWIQDLGWTSVWSVEQLEESGGFDVSDPASDIHPELSFDDKELKLSLAHALKKLPRREQQILYLYYQEDLTLKEIAYIMELSESQVSRIHSKTVLQLRASLM